jgi:hypothetical protein
LNKTLPKILIHRAYDSDPLIELAAMGIEMVSHLTTTAPQDSGRA